MYSILSSTWMVKCLSKKKPVNFDLNPGYGDDMRLLCCPQCGFDGGMHFLSVTVIQQPEQTVVTCNGTVVTLAHDALRYAQKQFTGRRGSVVSLEYWCEGCHGHGTLDYQFCKGEIRLTHTMCSNLSADEANELWRD